MEILIPIMPHWLDWSQPDYCILLFYQVKLGGSVHVMKISSFLDYSKIGFLFSSCLGQNSL